MTADYSPTEAQRLIAEAREDDATMVRGPWLGEEMIPTSDEDCQAIARTRNNLRAMTDQLEAAARGVDVITAERDSLISQLDHVRQVSLDSAQAALDAEAERDSLRQQFEAAQERWHEHWRSLTAESGATELRALKAESDLAAAQQRIAELEQPFAGFHLLDEARSALRAIYPVYRAAVEWRHMVTLLEMTVGRIDNRFTKPAHDLAAAVDTARAALTPEILAALERAGLETP